MKSIKVVERAGATQRAYYNEAILSQSEIAIEATASYAHKARVETAEPDAVCTRLSAKTAVVCIEDRHVGIYADVVKNTWKRGMQGKISVRYRDTRICIIIMDISRIA